MFWSAEGGAGAAIAGPGDVVVDGGRPIELGPHVDQHGVTLVNLAAAFRLGFIMRIRHVGIDGDDGTVIGDQAGLFEAGANETVHVPLRDGLAGSESGRDLLKRLGANAVDAAAGLQVHLQLLGGPTGFEQLNQVGRGGDLDARAANQLDGAAIHQRHIRDGAVRRILHRDLVAAGEQTLQAFHLRGPTGILADVAGQSGENAGLDGVDQALRIAVGGNEVIPAASGDVLRIQLQNPVGERIPLVMVKKQPAIQMFFAERA